MTKKIQNALISVWGKQLFKIFEQHTITLKCKCNLYIPNNKNIMAPEYKFKKAPFNYERGYIQTYTQTQFLSYTF